MTEISGIDEQISKDEWPKFMVIDARDPAQFAKGHIPGAINMDWRQVLVKRSTIPKKTGTHLLQHGLLVCSSWICIARSGLGQRQNFARWHGGVEGQRRLGCSNKSCRRC